MKAVNNHPSAEEIMAFVCPDGDVLCKEQFENDFNMIAHFVSCPDCRKIKDDMVTFIESIETALDYAGKDRSLTLKILHSLLQINPHNELVYNDVILACHGTVSLAAEKSAICFNTAKTEPTELWDNAKQEKTYVFAKNAVNKISLCKEQINVFLSDDGKKEHALLLIPEKAENEPKLCPMVKENCGWQVQCVCSEGEYDIVIF